MSMIVLFSLLTPAVAAVIAIVAWATGVFHDFHTWLTSHKQPEKHLDPSGDDADWQL